MNRTVSNLYAAAFLIAAAPAYADHGSAVSAADAECCNPGTTAADSTDTEAPKENTLAELEDVAELRDLFNADKGHPRAVAILSPVCPGCIASANLIQQSVLNAYPDADLRLYVVWLPMVPGDARERWSDERLNDTRATHFWNGSRSVGTWFASNVSTCEPLGPVAWDVIYLFEPDAEWTTQPPETVYCPAPAYRHPNELAHAANELLGKPQTDD